MRYTRTAVILHWLVAIAIFGMFALGWYMTGLPKDGAKNTAYDLFDLGIYTWQLTDAVSPRTFYFNLHKSVGITLFGLIIIRILWRITHKPPALLATYKTWERKLATGVHHLLYLLMVAMPLSGLITAVSSKYGVHWFGLPFMKGLDNDNLRDIFKDAHEIIAIIILLALILHITGALKHKWIDKDDTLKRMSL